MEQQYVIGARAGAVSQGQTLTAPGYPPIPVPARRCMALVPGSGPHYASEISCLLRYRLRLAVLIVLGGFGLFYLKGLLHQSDFGPDPIGRALHGIVIALLIFGCTLLWSWLPLSTRLLRGIELTLFGAMAIFFAYLQFRIYARGEFFESIPPSQRPGVISLANFANAMRWFVLIVLYGTFIPNTWRRCALVVATLALTPLALNFAICFPCTIMGPYTWPVLFDTTVVLALGAAIAIFGSYKLSELREEAFEARKLGQYRLVRKLGAGGMGEVYLGEHVLLRRACAIKLIHPDQAGDPVTFSRFEREVQAMATLTHWNTVEVYDYGHAEDGTFYYVMEYLPGLSLQELIERHGPLPPGRAIHFLRQLCGALKEAHAIGLIHRDIKPSNVIACQRGGQYDVAKLLDFGLVQDLSIGGAQGSDQRLTLQGTILGSPPYISPEQARGRGEVDARTDVYSLGGLAYFLLTGQAPFVRETIMELLVAHLHETPTPLRSLRPELPADLEDVVLTCLRKEASERYTDAASLDRALAACESSDDWDAEQAEHWWELQLLVGAAPKEQVAG